MSFLSDVTDQLNLRWAWEKVRSASTPGDVWIDEIELAGFELGLERNLQSIATEIKKGRYRLRPLRPMAFPKNPSKDGKQQVRQYFNVAVRDQVAWTAVVNVIGPHLDPLMPTWSYGNRLFRSIWIDKDDDEIHRRKIGRYRHSSGRIYLPFGQSWPVFRRHVYLATSAMTTKAGTSVANQLTEEDAEELGLQERLQVDYQCPFVLKEYWNVRQPLAGKENLFWCSVDLEKFYPSLKLDVVLRNIVEYLPPNIKIEAEILIESMMRFNLDTAGWSKEKPKELKAIGLKTQQATFRAIPTGLYVAGFLANIGLLKVDLEVKERLKKRDVAHFRFVDDHIVLAYSFDDLVNWIDEYLTILAQSQTGAKVNPEKIEPEALAKYLASRRKHRKSLSVDFEEAKKKCKLNPQFPTPLMTKTLALVSAIARVDIDLLDESDLVALTDQLEHMLLVELPEAEIPEKTRLSFAAMKLIRLAECRFSNNTRLVELGCRNQAMEAELADDKIPSDRRETLEQKSKETKKALKEQHDKLYGEIFRAFGLLRKVLQERPDRVRLWTRAIKMCRQTGVKGLKDIFCDIDRVEHELNNPLAAEYLRANTLSLLGHEAIIAAQLISNSEIAEWRRKAAHEFLTDITDACISEPLISERGWFLQKSWEQFCFGIFCSNLILKSSLLDDGLYKCQLPKELIVLGEQFTADKTVSGYPQYLAWWAARTSLRTLSSRGPDWVVEIGNRLPSVSESYSFWRFFPLDVPTDVLRGMQVDRRYSKNLAQMAGWWYDALSVKHEIAPSLLAKGRHPEIARAWRNLRSKNTRLVSLHEWCAAMRQIYETDASDPRASEWTALEIVRQVGMCITEQQEFSIEYVAKQRSDQTSSLCLHPANFRVPRKWLDDFKLKPPTWSEWKTAVNLNKTKVFVERVPEDLQIADSRYTPMQSPENALFESLNPVRGLGLLLYGMLRYDFELPSIWNGPGHADLLGLLPQCLLKERTFSSWTLALLQACLQPRAMENLFFLRHALGVYIHDDSLHDPINLSTVNEVFLVIKKSQAVLVDNQLSTLDHRARQLTPINIRQLSKWDWSKAVENVQEENGEDEH